MKAAPAPVLIRGTIAAAGNAQDLLRDAQLLAEAGSWARAYSLAALAIEEAGKAASLALLTVMPAALRAQAPVGRMLEWHQLKQLHGLLVGAVSFRVPGFAARVAAMPAGELTQILSTLDAPAEQADRLKRYGLYVDVDRGGRVREPSQITQAEVHSVLARAGQAVSAVGEAFEPDAAARLLNPPPAAIECSRAAVSAFAEIGSARTPQAATDVVLTTLSKLRARLAAKDAEGTPVLGELRPRRHTTHAARRHHRAA